MRIFALDHPDQARALPAHFSDWALMFDRVERAVDEEKEIERLNGLLHAMWGG